MEADVVFRIVDLIGVLGNGLLGGVLARTQKYDLIGFLILALSTALGGGMIRDALLQQGFPVALTDPYYLWVASFAAVAAYIFPFESKLAVRSIAVFDVLALGCWSATGASKALLAGLDWAPAILLGVITATGGGVIRDLLAGRTPLIFGGAPVYATWSILASLLMVIMQSSGHYNLGMALAILLSTIFGLVGRRLNWVLPGAVTLGLKRVRFKTFLSKRRPPRMQGSASESAPTPES
ncbi:MAG: TRIC cation channel family protein [Actinomycetaceae bacterium]|nr:TRIC cation channel family protein [Actinomycetaceae bacterium]